METQPITLNLFSALQSIGATMDPMWHGEWDGPILFRDDKGAHRLILVLTEDHDEFDKWHAENPEHDEEKLKEFGRHMLVKMAIRPINLEDYV